MAGEFVPSAEESGTIGRRRARRRSLAIRESRG